MIESPKTIALHGGYSPSFEPHAAAALGLNIAADQISRHARRKNYKINV
ncbi:hypothetical protein [Methylomonas methanica]|nr:hypothetical protein [Methylomonas methanica]